MLGGSATVSLRDITSSVEFENDALVEIIDFEGAISDSEGGSDAGNTEDMKKKTKKLCEESCIVLANR